MKCFYDAYTDIGGREQNEDSFYAGETNNGLLFAVADGLGGYAYGEIASDLVIDVIKEHFFYGTKDFCLEYVIENANEQLVNKQKQIGNKMKTTVSAVCIRNDSVVLGNVGDSRIYVFSDTGIVFQSIDHSVAQMAVFAGEISGKEIRKHEDRNILTRALGASDSVKVDMFEIDNSKYTAILLCTDGFWEYVLEEEMLDSLKRSVTPREWLLEMREILKKRLPSGCDNNTAITIMKQGV